MYLVVKSLEITLLFCLEREQILNRYHKTFCQSLGVMSFVIDFGVPKKTKKQEYIVNHNAIRLGQLNKYLLMGGNKGHDETMKDERNALFCCCIIIHIYDLT